MDRDFAGDAQVFRASSARNCRAKFLFSGSSGFAVDFVN
jgi:hypothetical protein